jgi:uncharacterized membrane protein
VNSLIAPENHAMLWALIAAGTALSIWLEQTYRLAARLSGPVLALLIAMILTNARVMPTASPAYDFVGDWLVPLAIPLLLFRANLKEIIRTGGRVFAIFHLSAVGTLLGVVAAAFLLQGNIPRTELVHAAGLMTASYIGGGVNFVAIKSTYAVPENTANTLLVADNFVMASMFVAMLAIAGSRWARARFPHPHTAEADPAAAASLAATHWSRKGIGLLDVAKSFAIAFAVLAVATALGGAIKRGFGEAAESDLLLRMLRELCSNKFVLLTVLTLAAATVFAGPLSRINGPEEFGAYLLCLFLFTLGLPADLWTVITQAPLFFVFCGIIALVNLAFTLTAGKLLRLNLEELLLVVNANLGGAPSASAMAISAGWSRLVLPALLVGIWGYVIGTPIGIMVVEYLNR